MPAYYKLVQIDPDRGSNHAQMITIEGRECHVCEDPTVEAITPEEFKEIGIFKDAPNFSPAQFIDMENSFIEDYPDYIVGSFSVPSKDPAATDPSNFAFYMDKTNLIFIDNSGYAQVMLDKMARSGMVSVASTAHCLQLFIKTMIGDDLVFLSKLEDQMEDMEESLLVENAEVDTTVIMDYRRLSIHLSSFYEQLDEMCDLLSDNENRLMSDDDARSFRHLSNLCSRLTSRADTLKEYSLQLYEMQQTLIDEQQNSIMKILTIVTVLFAPLTLVTGWFGMNLSVIPGLGFDFMWLSLIIVFAASTALLLLFFHKKKWL